MNYKYNEKPKTTFTTEANEIINSIISTKTSVLIGRNNCGKSFLLKTITEKVGSQASYLGPARYQNFNLLGYYNPRSDNKEEKYRQFLHQFKNNEQNIDNSPLNLQQAIADLSNIQRETLFKIIKDLLGIELKIILTVPENDMSQKYVSCDNYNISYSSSGVRLITTLITSLLESEYDTFLIDEPELGISPETQGALSDFIFDEKKRSKYFPHIKHLILATHSTIFLDRDNISNNYTMTKTGDVIDIKKTNNIIDFNNIHFYLLGNRLESLYLPSCIVITEGKTDYEYISKILSLKYPKTQFSIINATNDGKIKELVHTAGSIFTDLQKSPYRNRIVPILDKVHGTGIIETLKKMGIPEENITVWQENGIEYYYPNSIMDEIYGKGGALEVKDDSVLKNGIVLTKWDLCKKVLLKISSEVQFHEEVNELIIKIGNIIK